MLPGQTYTPEHIAALAWKYRWHLMVPTAVLAALVALISLKIPNRYRSETVILIVPQRVPDSYVKSTVTTRIQDRLPSISQEILSRTKLERVINDDNLYPKIRRTALMEDVVARMRAAIDVEVVKGDAFRVSYKGDDAKIVADVTNRLAALFVEENLHDREVVAEGTNQFLQSELESARTSLVEHERKLEIYRKAHANELPTQLNANMQAAQNTQIQIQNVIDSVNRNRDRRLNVEQQISELAQTDVLPVPGTRPLPRPEELASASLTDQLEVARHELRDLESRLTDQHPDVIRQRRVVKDLETRAAAVIHQSGEPVPATTDPAALRRQARLRELRGELANIDRQIATGQAEELRLRSLAEEFQQRIDATPTREADLTALMRDYTTLQAVYSSLLQKREDAKMSANLERRQGGEQFKVLDPARPAERPFFPNRLVFAGVGAALGLFLALAGLGFLEYRDTSLRSEEDATTALALPVLAVIPVLRGARDARRHRWMHAFGNVVCSGVVVVCALVVGWAIGLGPFGGR